MLVRASLILMREVLKRMKRILSSIFFTLCSSSFIHSAFSATENTMAPVSGFARSFVLNTPISNAKITILETGQQIKTDKKGHFGPILYPVGKPITLYFEKFGYKATQSGTMIVPKSGLTDNYHNISFQIPSIPTYYILAYLVGAKINEESCHVASTITAYHKTLDDVPQGESDAIANIKPNSKETPFYFGIFKNGPLKGYTNPFTKGLIKSSEDGGVLFFNLPPRTEPYTLTAEKNGVEFSQAQFLCRKGVFINISPPLGPMSQRE